VELGRRDLASTVSFHKTPLSEPLGEALILGIAGHVADHVDVVGSSNRWSGGSGEPEVHGRATDEYHVVGDGFTQASLRSAEHHAARGKHRDLQPIGRRSMRPSPIPPIA
jgi:hypothetical protein